MPEKKEPASQLPSQTGDNGMTESEIDRNLAETFPASDPPSWTLGTDHRAAPEKEASGDGEETD